MLISKIKLLKFLTINILKLSTVNKPNPLYFNGYTIRCCKLSELKKSENVYQKISGRSFSHIQKLLLKLFSNKNLILAIDESNNKIIALNLYYINHRDFDQNSIHGGYIGVLPEYQDQGIATKMREYAKAHFRAAGFLGISSRISKNNLASLHSAERSGFKIVEQYFDAKKQEERYYLICNLRNRNL